MKNLLPSLFGFGNSNSQPSEKKKIDSIYSRSNFLKLIELERYRVHRDNRQFSLILFNVNQNKNLSIGELLNHISKRIRRIDQVGWYDNFHIGVLLPNTTPNSAQSIAEDICKNHTQLRSSLQYETLTYPDAN